MLSHIQFESSKMGGKIPTTIRRQVFKDWLSANPRNKIAEKNQIGEATVSAIINESREEYPDIDLLRELTVALRKENLSLADFASVMRLRNKLLEWGLPEEPEIEDFIEKVNVYCFKAGISPDKFIDMIHYATLLANQLNSSIEGLPSKISEEQKRLKTYKKKAERLRNMIETLLAAYNVTEDDIEEYKNTRPILVEENTKLKMENTAYKKDVVFLRKTNRELETELFEYKYKEMISENELKKLERSWLPNENPISVKELHELAHEIYYHPAQNIDIIRRIRANRVQRAAA